MGRINGTSDVGIHMAGTRGGNPSPVVNWGNKGGGQASGEARRGNHAGGQATHTLKHPAAAAVPGGLLTFARVHAYQCESNVTYQIKHGSPEGDYFLRQAVFALENTRELMQNGAASCALMQAFANRADETFLEIAHVKYHQLEHVATPSSDMLKVWDHESDYRPDGYETFDYCEKAYAVNSSGYFYKINKSMAWDWTFKLLIKGDLGDFQQNQDDSTPADDDLHMTYAVHFSVVKLPKGETYCEGKVGSKVLLLEYGEMLSQQFTPWPGAKIYVCNKDIVQAMCTYTQWKPRHPPRAEPEFTGEDAFKSYSQKYTFSIIDDVTCCYFPPVGKTGEGVYKPLANFAIDSVIAVYQFADREKGLPWFRYKVHMELDANKDDLMYVTPERDVPLEAYKSAGRLEAEVMVPLNEVDDKTLGSWFGKVSAYLQIEGYFKVEHLKALTNQLTPWPNITRVVTHFGRQPNSKMFVFGNCCYARGQLYSHEEAGITVLPHMFGGKDTVIPLSVAKFPKILLVAQDWVRYKFYHDTWRQTLDLQFLNNVMQAKATIALGVLHLQCSKFWYTYAPRFCCPNGVNRSLWLRGSERKSNPAPHPAPRMDLACCHPGMGRRSATWCRLAGSNRLRRIRARQRCSWRSTASWAGSTRVSRWARRPRCPPSSSASQCSVTTRSASTRSRPR